MGVPYEYVDVDRDESAARQVEEWNDGKRRTPTVALLSGERLTLLSVPEDEELDSELQRFGAVASGVLPGPS